MLHTLFQTNQLAVFHIFDLSDQSGHVWIVTALTVLCV